jgi:hypothetical protein
MDWLTHLLAAMAGASLGVVLMAALAVASDADDRLTRPHVIDDQEHAPWPR